MEDAAPPTPKGRVSAAKITMKYNIVVVLLALASIGYCQQTPGNGGQWVPPHIFNEHPEHASAQGLGTEHSLLGTSQVYAATGERPLWEVYRPLVDVSLGDFARACREEHATATKAKLLYTN